MSFSAVYSSRYLRSGYSSEVSWNMKCVWCDWCIYLFFNQLRMSTIQGKSKSKKWFEMTSKNMYFFFSLTIKTSRKRFPRRKKKLANSRSEKKTIFVVFFSFHDYLADQTNLVLVFSCTFFLQERQWKSLNATIEEDDGFSFGSMRSQSFGRSDLGGRWVLLQILVEGAQDLQLLHQ